MIKKSVLLFQVLLMTCFLGCDFLGANQDFSFELVNDTFYILTTYHGDDAHVEIPAKYCDLDVSVIGEEAFLANLYLESVVIPETVNIIQDSAFANALNLTSVDMPDTVTYIGESAFYMTALADITLPSQLKDIKAYAFAFTDIEAIIIPEGVKKISQNAFLQCDELVSLELPESLTFIGLNAFMNNRSLLELDIPEGVRTIEYGAFYDCENLTIYVPFPSAPAGWASGWNEGVNQTLYSQ